VRYAVANTPYFCTLFNSHSLEDREILSQEYFDEIAQENPQWQDLLNAPDFLPRNLEPEAKQFYIRILGNKDFTYALFERLANDKILEL